MFIKLPDVIILAGGLGTRLSETVKDIPKALAPVNGRPFLEYQLKQILKAGLKKVILSTGFLGDQIKNYFGDRYLDLEILYSHENEPLGTGGAVKKAFEQVQTPYALVINGDTLFRIDLDLFFQLNVEKLADVSIALRLVNDASRFGSVKVNAEGNILSFSEKVNNDKAGLINGGIYLISARYFKNLSLPDRFSLEKEFFGNQVTSARFYGQVFDNYFIDIGIPEDYKRAQYEIGES